MPYDERLAERARTLLKEQRGLVEKKMFGGLAYLLNGNMFAGILHKDLVVRVGPEGHDAALNAPHTRPMDFTGKPMKGYIYVSSNGTKTPGQLRKWLAIGLVFVTTLSTRKRKPVRSTLTIARRNKRKTS